MVIRPLNISNAFMSPFCNLILKLFFQLQSGYRTGTYPYICDICFDQLCLYLKSAGAMYTIMQYYVHHKLT